MIKKLSVIIVTFNSEELILDCLQSIFKFNDIGNSLEIIIVDNSKNSNMMFANIRKLYSDDIKLISNSNNYGYGEGNNIGISVSTSPNLLIMNPDARLIFPIFKSAISRFEKNKEVSIIGPKEVYENLKPATSFYYRMEHQSLIRILFWQKLFNKLDVFKQSKMYINGACFFIRKDSFQKAGCFDSDIFLYAEEPDLITRIEKSNPTSICEYDPKMKIIHLKKQSYNSLSTLKIAVDSAVYYLGKYNFDIAKYIKRRSTYSKLKFIQMIVTGKKDEAKVYQDISSYMKGIKY